MNWQRKIVKMTYANPQYLVETDWLAAHLDDANIRVFDVTGFLTATFRNRAKKRYYDNGHIPGAVYLDVASPRSVFSKDNAQLPWTWPEREPFEALMGQIGVDNESQVVLYAATPRRGIDFGLMWCTRAWWVMRHFGVRCAVLNGGWEKWLSEGHPVSEVPGSYEETTFTADPDWRRGLATKEDVLAALQRTDSTCVVDALSKESYAGTDKMVYGPRKGHITGAVSVPMDTLVHHEPFYMFKDGDEIWARFEQAGVKLDGDVVAYCGGGIASTVDAFALALIGYENVALYDGSLFEWAADSTLPMTDPSENN